MKKKRQSEVVGVDLRAVGGLHGPGKPGWSASDMVKEPENQMKIQQQNEEHQQITIHIKNEQQQQHKNISGDSPKQSNIAASFWLLVFKNDYKINYNKKSFYMKNL